MLFGDYELAVRRINEEAEDPRLYQDLGSFARIRKIFDEVRQQDRKRESTELHVQMAVSLLGFHPSC
jgi:hypothetical protein